MKPFLILQLRPETETSDDEFAAILEKGGLTEDQTVRVRLDQQDSVAEDQLSDYAGIIVGGGPGCVSDAEDEKSDVEKKIENDVLRLMPAVTSGDIPFLGCCYGIGILAHHLGALVGKDCYGEDVGAVRCYLTEEGKSDPLLRGFPETFMAFVGHKEAVQELPRGCVHLLRSDPCPVQMIRYKDNVYATQFHPEADADVFEVRINIYKDKGYFAPEDAERIIAKCQQQDVDVPERILRRFVEVYGSA